MRSIKWVKEDYSEQDLISAVRVRVSSIFHCNYELQWSDEDFIVVIYRTDNNYSLYFKEEKQYREFIAKDMQELIFSTVETPMLFRNTSNKDFLAKESDDSLLYHIITSMIADKFYEIKQEII